MTDKCGYCGKEPATICWACSCLSVDKAAARISAHAREDHVATVVGTALVAAIIGFVTGLAVRVGV